MRWTCGLPDEHVSHGSTPLLYSPMSNMITNKSRESWPLILLHAMVRQQHCNETNPIPLAACLLLAYQRHSGSLGWSATRVLPPFHRLPFLPRSLQLLSVFHTQPPLSGCTFLMMHRKAFSTKGSGLSRVTFTQTPYWWANANNKETKARFATCTAEATILNQNHCLTGHQRRKFYCKATR